MPDRLHQACRENGCRKRTNARSGYCPDHEKANTALEAQRIHNRERRDDPINKMYETRAWEAFRLHVLNRNPLCQRIGTDGMQCRYPATLIHHLISPRVDVNKFMDPQNVVALCAACHPPSEGTPDWVAGRDFVESVIAAPTVA